MTKDEYTQILDNAFNEGIPFIDYTTYYSYALVLKNGQWLEISYEFEEHEIIEKRELKPLTAYNHFCEEIEKALAEVVEVFYLNRWRDFKESLSGDEGEMLKKMITEITTNIEKYGKDLPIVLNQDGIATLKAKL